MCEHSSKREQTVHPALQTCVYTSGDCETLVASTVQDKCQHWYESRTPVEMLLPLKRLRLQYLFSEDSMNNYVNYVTTIKGCFFVTKVIFWWPILHIVKFLLYCTHTWPRTATATPPHQRPGCLAVHTSLLQSSNIKIKLDATFSLIQTVRRHLIFKMSRLSLFWSLNSRKSSRMKKWKALLGGCFKWRLDRCVSVGTHCVWR